MKNSFLILLFSLFGNFEEEASPYDLQIDRIQENFISEVQKRKKLDVTNAGRACPDAIRQINVGFASNEEGTVERARRDIVWLGQTLLNKMNSDLEIRPYLYTFPCNGENIEIGVSYDDSYTPIKNIKRITHAHLYDNRITYLSRDDSLQTIETIFSESFDEAIQRIQ